MTDLISETADAASWVRQAQSEHVPGEIFGTIRPSVIWADVKGPNGEDLIAVDPLAIIDDVKLGNLSLLKGHDPGFPVGKVLSAAVFASPEGTRFIAAILGLYQGVKLDGFDDLGLGFVEPFPPPSQLPDLTDTAWIEFRVDPREVEAAWVKDALANPPLRVEERELSHNAADAVTQLISIGFPYALLVWNPFVKAFATEAGKDAYAATKQWLKRLFRKLPKLDNPIVELVSHHSECQVSFILRGSDVKSHDAALEALSVAARTAAALVHKMTLAGVPPVKLIYEFREEDGIWSPSFAELKSGKLITDNAKLIAVEKLPTGLSLGLAIPKVGPP